MKPILPVLVAAVFLFAGCDRKKAEMEAIERKNAELQAGLAEEQRMANVRAAEEVAARQLAATEDAARQFAASQAAINDETARKLAEDRAALEAEKARLSEKQKLAAEADLRLREEALQARERRLTDAREAAARQTAGIRVTDKREPSGLARPEPPVRGKTVGIFYETLDRHGDWIESDGYGYVFQPAVAASRGWRPYTDGEWIWSDHGWAWRSNEPFGWATYHYGRWVRLNRRGWVWVPGSEWAPAWVSWRRGDDHIGWAPLPPEAHSSSGFNAAVDDYFDIGVGAYVFVQKRDFSAGRTYVGRYVEPERNVNIIQRTVNVTNVKYEVINRQTVVVNRGPDPAASRTAAVAPVRPVRLERVDAAPPDGGGEAQVNAGVLPLVAPVIVNVAVQAKPKIVKSKEGPGVDRGWSGVDPDVAKQFRERRATEARRIEARQRESRLIGGTPPEKAPAVAPSAPVARTEPGPPVRGSVVAPAQPVAAQSAAPLPTVAPDGVKPQAPPSSPPADSTPPVVPVPPVEKKPAPVKKENLPPTSGSPKRSEKVPDAAADRPVKPLDAPKSTPPKPAAEPKASPQGSSPANVPSVRDPRTPSKKVPPPAVPKVSDGAGTKKDKRPVAKPGPAPLITDGPAAAPKNSLPVAPDAGERAKVRKAGPSTAPKPGGTTQPDGRAEAPTVPKKAADVSAERKPASNIGKSKAAGPMPTDKPEAPKTAPGNPVERELKKLKGTISEPGASPVGNAKDAAPPQKAPVAP